MQEIKIKGPMLVDLASMKNRGKYEDIDGPYIRHYVLCYVDRIILYIMKNCKSPGISKYFLTVF